MVFMLSNNPWLIAITIIFLRIGDMALGALRIHLLNRRFSLLAWIVGFFQSLLFVLAIVMVFTSVDHILAQMVAYAVGFATGSLVSVWLEERLSSGFLQFNIVSSTRGAAIADQLRTSGYAVTEIPARGRNGTVTLLQANVKRKDMDNIETIVLEADPEAFVTLDEIRPVRRGFWRA